MNNKKQLIGQKYNYLTVIAEAPRRKRKTMWLCKCDCGVEKVIESWSLQNSKTLSCGCYGRKNKSDICKKLNPILKRTHGLSRSKEYYVFMALKSRCLNMNRIDYKNYGGKGIEVKWLNFDQFILDMGCMPDNNNNWQVHRLDSKGHYCKENCVWLERSEHLSYHAKNRVKKIFLSEYRKE